MKTLAIIGLLVLALIAFGVAPFVFIWAVNTLFGVGVKYTLLNWFAALLLLGLSRVPAVRSKDD